ncbi:hypothetical protein [Halorussus litoreus]|uniref:hypothetical protein n=1 Tax=Halorussus litoreus TaxID=1710536 RepID=UPI000E24CDDE|nr:hypothetical protein [Halorussus litoreus]
MRRRSSSTRRQFLGASAAVLAGGLAGCAATDDPACEGADRSSVAAERATPPAAVREAVVPIHFDELSDGEKDVAAKAIRSDEYVECAPVSDAFESFLDRIGDHRERQHEESDDAPDTVYLVRERSYYALDASVGEETVSW